MSRNSYPTLAFISTAVLMCLLQKCAAGDYSITTSNQKCGENEEYRTCGTCPATCQLRYPRACLDNCVAGCFCLPGFIRAHVNGTCISEQTCEGRCRVNEYFTGCGTACPKTCSRQDGPCNKQCADGCFCQKGFVLEDRTQICIPQERCPKPLF